MNQKGSSEDESDNEEVPSLIETEKEFSIMKNKESLKGKVGLIVYIAKIYSNFSKVLSDHL